MTFTTEKLEASKKLARDYIDQVFNQHNPAKAADFVTGDVFWHGGALGDITGAENLAGLLGSFIGGAVRTCARPSGTSSPRTTWSSSGSSSPPRSREACWGCRPRQSGPVGRGGHLRVTDGKIQRGVGRRRHRDDYGPESVPSTRRGLPNISRQQPVGFPNSASGPAGVGMPEQARPPDHTRGG